MKTIMQALLDEVHYPIPPGFVENVLIRRQLEGSDEYSHEVSVSNGYLGAVADCLWSLVQAISFSESDKSFGALTDKDKERILLRVNSIYNTIGEPTVELEEKPMVYVKDFLL